MKKNDIGKSGLDSLDEVLDNSKTIKELDLAGNNIGDEGVIRVVEHLKNKLKTKTK